MKPPFRSFTFTKFNSLFLVLFLGQQHCATANNCNAGTYLRSGSCCWSCPWGYHQSESGQSSCARCPIGYHAYSGYKSCPVCRVGLYASSVGYCNGCNYGSYQDEKGKQSCKKCQPGHAQNSYAQTTCGACAAGRYEDETGGFTYPEPSHCKPCTTGKEFNTTVTVCNACATGKYQDQSNMYLHPNHRTNMPSYAPLNTVLSCKFCPSGWSSFDSTTCQRCSRGRYQFENANIVAVCIDGCPAGTYQGTNGQYIHACQDCQIGKHSTYGSSSCSPCPRGRYGDKTGLSACKKCEAGRYGDSNFLTSFDQCKFCK